MVDKVGEYQNNYIKWHQSFSRAPVRLAQIHWREYIDYQLVVERTALTESLSRYNFTLRSVSMHSHFFICEHRDS